MTFFSPSYVTDSPASIGNVEFGTPPVKILSSVCGRNAEEMIEQAKAIEEAGADVIEWRADYFDEAGDWREAVRQMKAAVAKPILYTFRTRAEGGVCTTPLSDTSYRKKVIEAIESGLFEAVDIEIARGRAEQLVDAARQAGVTSIVSWHYLDPEWLKADDVSDDTFVRLAQMTEVNPDIVKIAVMPTKANDITYFMDSVALWTDTYQPPVIAMCMGKVGALTRVGASAFGSCATFASAAQTSAPGQLDVATTRKLLELFSDDPEIIRPE